MVLVGRDWTPPSGIETAAVDLSTYDGGIPQHWKRDFDAMLCVAPIKLIPAFLPHFPRKPGLRAVFLSSNNTALLPNNPDYSELRRAEATISASDLDAVILQPTVISGREGGPVLGHISEKIRSGRPLWLAGRHTRQWPVHYRDVARAMIHALNPSVPAGLYSLAGHESLTYAEMVARVERLYWTPARPRFVPAPLARMAGWVLREQPALTRAGIDRRPVNDPLPDFETIFSVNDMLRSLTDREVMPSSTAKHETLSECETPYVR